MDAALVEDQRSKVREFLDNDLHCHDSRSVAGKIDTLPAARIRHIFNDLCVCLSGQSRHNGWLSPRTGSQSSKAPSGDQTVSYFLRLRQRLEISEHINCESS